MNTELSKTNPFNKACYDFWMLFLVFLLGHPMVR